MGGMSLPAAAPAWKACAKSPKRCSSAGANALPVGIRDWPDGTDNPAWTTVAGLAMYSAKLKSQRDARQMSAAGKILK